MHLIGQPTVWNVQENVSFGKCTVVHLWTYFVLNLIYIKGKFCKLHAVLVIFLNFLKVLYAAVSMTPRVSFGNYVVQNPMTEFL